MYISCKSVFVNTCIRKYFIQLCFATFKTVYMSEVIFSTDQSKTSLPNLEALKIMNTLRTAVQLRNNSTVIPTLMKFSQRVHTSLKTYK